jgi:anhydro-N-acetylmuramic acid kinase
VVLNIGGIANITRLPAHAEQDVLGFDTGPGNGLMDAWTERHLGRAMDTDAAWANQGEVLDEVLGVLLADPYFDKHPPKSTGKEDFNLQWVEHRFTGIADCPPASVQRTLCELTAVSIGQAIRAFASNTREVLVCGGGCRNPLLMRRLRESLPSVHVGTTAEHGINPDFVEAAMVAWIAMRTLNGQAGNIPSATGARHSVVLGGVYPGALNADT